MVPVGMEQSPVVLSRPSRFHVPPGSTRWSAGHAGKVAPGGLEQSREILRGPRESRAAPGGFMWYPVVQQL